MPYVQRNGLVGLSLRFLAREGKSFSSKAMATALEFLSLTFDSEAYSCRPESFMPEDKLDDYLQEVGERYVRPLTDDDRDMRRRLRPLLDEIEDRQ